MSAPPRTCPQCGREFAPKRQHHRYDTGECRQQAWVEKQVHAAQISAQRVKEVARRRTRDGKGAKVYMTPPEIEVAWGALVELGAAKAGEAGKRLAQKLLDASGRIEEKAA